MLARGVAVNQPLLLIDEPLAGIDSNAASKIMKLLDELSVAGHSMLILSSGQYEFEIPEAKRCKIVDGVLV